MINGLVLLDQSDFSRIIWCDIFAAALIKLLQKIVVVTSVNLPVCVSAINTRKRMNIKTMTMPGLLIAIPAFFKCNSADCSSGGLISSASQGCV